MSPTRYLAKCGLLLAVLCAVAPLRRCEPEPCSDDYVRAIANAHDPAQTHKPQLTTTQMLWVASMVRASEAQLGAPISLLVFGLGADTPAWLQINCRGRTVFIENNNEWLKLVTQVIAAKYNETLEAHMVKYKGNMKEAQQFFDKPWLVEVPSSVEKDCFPVILVDAPNGYDANAGQPGRMESVYFAIQKARSCIEQGRLQHVHLFLHDMNRQLEQQIAVKLLNPRNGALYQGTIKGHAGDLAGFLVKKPFQQGP